MEAEQEKPTKATDILDAGTLKDINVMHVMKAACGMTAAIADFNLNGFGDLRLQRLMLVHDDSDFIPKS